MCEPRCAQGFEFELLPVLTVREVAKVKVGDWSPNSLLRFSRSAPSLPPKQ